MKATSLCRVLLVIVACLCACLQIQAQSTPSSAPKLSPADEAWLDVRAANFTGDTSKQVPTDAVARKAAIRQQAERFLLAADRANKFHTTYPEHPKADEARAIEVQALLNAVRAGDATLDGRLTHTVETLRADSRVPVKTKAKAVAMYSFHTALRGKKTSAERLLAIEETARTLTADFPTEPQGYESLLTVAHSTDDEKTSRKIAQELLKAPSGETVKQGAKKLVERLDLLGKPVDVELDAANAKSAAAARKSGQPTVIYTWATWSQSSIDMAAALKKRGVKGNVIALNVDTDTTAAAALAAKEALIGTAVYDERGMEGSLAQRFKVRTAPQVIIVDSAGKIRDIRGESDLDKKLTQYGL